VTLAEFEDYYSLHDSSIEEIEYTAENKKLILTVNNQQGFTELIFDSVSLFEYDGHEFKNILEDIDTEVVTTEFKDDVLKIIIREYKDAPFDEDYFQINIKAESVTINPLD